jgi:hypothetical protein
MPEKQKQQIKQRPNRIGKRTTQDSYLNSNCNHSPGNVNPIVSLQAQMLFPGVKA